MPGKTTTQPTDRERDHRWRRVGRRTRVPALGYASVQGGLPLDGPEVQNQRQTIERACRGLGLDLLEVLRDHVPNGPGGDRPGLLHALERIRSGEASCLVVSDLDRLSSSPIELATLLDRLEEHRGRLVAVDVGLDSETPAGRLAVSPRPRGRRVEAPREKERARPERRDREQEAAAEERRAAVAEARTPVEEPRSPVEEPRSPVEEPLTPLAEPFDVEEPAPAEQPSAPVEEPPAPVDDLELPGPAPAPETDEAVELPAPPPVARPPERVAGPAELMRALGYASVPAKDDPDAAEVLEEQRQAIERTCERLGLELVEIVREREPSSGKALDRAGISYLIERLAAGDASCLVVTGLDRLSRSVAELGTLVQWLEKSDVRLVAVELDLDTLSPGGRTAARALASVGGWERERLSERTRKGLAAARAKRRTGGGPGPDWTAIRNRIAVMRADGMTLQAIADVLNEEGVPTPRGGLKWRPSSVQGAAGYKRRSRAKGLADLPTVERPASAPDPPESR